MQPKASEKLVVTEPTRSDDELMGGDLFAEPEGYYKAPSEPHFASYKRKVEPQNEISLRLVGLLPLWGHLLWNAGIYTADHLDRNAASLVKGKRILELGAAAALPSLICAVNEAEKVVSTDYPDADLITNIKYNFEHCAEINSPYAVQGYIWGNDVRPLVCGSDESLWPQSVTDIPEKDKFDIIILSDVVFNHTEHLKLLETCRSSLKKLGKCLVVFSPHRPWLLEADLQFFTTCEQFDFKAEKIEMVKWKPMFEEDEETVDIRARVYAYYLVPQW